MNVVCCSSEQIIKRCLQHSNCGVPVVSGSDFCEMYDHKLLSVRNKHVLDNNVVNMLGSFQHIVKSEIVPDLRKKVKVMWPQNDIMADN